LPGTTAPPVPELGVAVGVTVGVAVGVALGLALGLVLGLALGLALGLGLGLARAQLGPVIVLVSRCTAPLRASALPLSVALFCSVIEA
jgi:hypothetical protein